mmetsp:Transcript_70077/g.130995  ORF Transcript_70077/g.130995 Transcript_70077/m.130995 type:complete len:117 (-) Transcript_70077:103-453(-)
MDICKNICIKVHVREKTFPVKCGDGRQRVRWLANVAIVRYDEKTKGMDLGVPWGIQLEDGTRVNMDDTITARLTDGLDVWVLLPEDKASSAGAKSGAIAALTGTQSLDVTLPVTPR